MNAIVVSDVLTSEVKKKVMDLNREFFINRRNPDAIPDLLARFAALLSEVASQTPPDQLAEVEDALYGIFSGPKH